MGLVIEETPAEHHIVLRGLLFRIVHIPLVKLLEALRDVHAIRTGHAVPAVGAGDHYPLFKFFPDLPVQGKFCLRERTRTPGICESHILADLVHLRHAREDNRHLRVVPDPAKRPFGRTTRGFCLLPDLPHSSDIPPQQAAPDRFHDNDPEPLLRRVAQPLRPRLVVLVHEIVLDLGKRPVVGVHNFLKQRHGIMEREPGMADPPVSDCIGKEVRDAEPREVLPEPRVEPVHQVKINVIGFQPHQLFIEVIVHVPAGRDQPAGELGSEVHLFAIPAGKCPADKGFALPVMVGICRIHIIHAVVDGVPEHLRCMVLVDLPVLFYGEPHAPEPEDGEFRGCPVHFPIEHVRSPFQNPDTYALGDKGSGLPGKMGRTPRDQTCRTVHCQRFVSLVKSRRLWRGLRRARGGDEGHLWFFYVGVCGI